jgi:hypothetical protein
MSSPLSRSPKWRRLFSVAVVLMLLGAGILVVYAINNTKSGTSAFSQGDSAFYTAAANTLAAIQTATSSTSASSTETPLGTPSATGFPQFDFTPAFTSNPDSSSPVPSLGENSCNNSTFAAL